MCCGYGSVECGVWGGGPMSEEKGQGQGEAEVKCFPQSRSVKV